MALQKTLRRVGNSIGIYLAPHMVAGLGWEVGDKMDVTFGGGGLIIRKFVSAAATPAKATEIASPEAAADSIRAVVAPTPSEVTLDLPQKTRPNLTPLDYIDPRQRPDW